MSDQEPPRCPCGHDREHTLVSPEAEYTFGGWFLSMVGISARPIAIRFVCRRCGHVVERSTNEKILTETRLWG